MARQPSLGVSSLDLAELASAGSALSSDCVGDIELDAAISALETEWIAQGISLCSLANQNNANTLRTLAASEASSADLYAA
ncbi:MULTISPECIES: hypothetical protein [unclassified Bradyrhizobium]